MISVDQRPSETETGSLSRMSRATGRSLEQRAPEVEAQIARQSVVSNRSCHGLSKPKARSISATMAGSRPRAPR